MSEPKGGEKEKGPGRAIQQKEKGERISEGGSRRGWGFTRNVREAGKMAEGLR